MSSFAKWWRGRLGLGLAVLGCVACTHGSTFRLVAGAKRSDGADCAKEHRVHPISSAVTIDGPRLALVIGNDSYPVGELNNARNDAKAIAERLERLGFQVRLIFDATHEVMKQAVAEFGKKREAQPGLGLFYYAGHGLQYNGLNYLIPVDAEIRDADSVVREAIAAEEILKATGAGGGYSIAILDACRDIPFPGVRSAVPRGLAEMNAPSNMLLAYATAPGETARDAPPEAAEARVGRSASHGVYTGALLEHIEDEGLTVDQVLARTAGDVRAATQQLQRPWRATDWTGDVYLKPGRPARTEDILALANANHEAHDYLSVVHDLAPLLATTAFAVTDEQRQQAAQLLADAQLRLSQLTLQIEPKNASLRMDGTLYHSDEGSLCLNPGDHHVEISDDGYQPLMQSVQLQEGSAQRVAARLRKQDSVGHGPKLAWTFGAVGAASLVTSLATRVRAGKLNQKLDQVCGGSTCPSDSGYDWQREQDTGHRLVITSGVMFGVGLASVAASAALVFRPQWFPWNRERSGIARLSCDQMGCSASSSWAF